MLRLQNALVVSLVVATSVAACQSEAPGGGGAPLAGASSSEAGDGGSAGAVAGGRGGLPATSGAAGARPGEGGAGAAAAGSAGAAAGGAGGAVLGGAGGAEAGEGGEGGSPALPGHLYGYVSTVLGDLLLLSVDSTSGALAQLDSSPLEVDGFLHGVAVDRSEKFLFLLAEPSRIDTYPIAEDGSLPAEPSSSVSIDDDNPALTWTFDPQGRFAYVASPFSQTIYSFALNGESGVLEAIGEPLLVGPAPEHRLPAFAAADPSGHFVYVTQLADPSAPANDNGIRGYRINQETGALSELPESPFGDVVAGAIVFRPDGKFLFSSGGALNAFAVDPESGNLSLVEGSPFTTDVGSDPWAINLAVTPQGDFVYVSHFLPTQHVSGFAIDPESGVLEAVPGSPLTTSAPYSIAIDPTGRFLLVGDDSGRVPAYSLSRDDGSLSELEGSPFGFGGLEPEFAFVTRP